MTIRDLKGQVKDLIPVRNVLLSVFDKSGLETFVPELIEACPGVRFLSTGGTYKKLQGMLKDDPRRVIEVAEYTGAPEMEGGLVKTLHPKVHGGILGERNNQDHQRYLSQVMNTNEQPGVYLDIVAVNLYPFQQVVSSPDVTFEKARGNIDIGGPTMIRAAAKNFPSCAVVCDPLDYTRILQEIRDNNGCTSFNTRLDLAKKVFATTAEYDAAINNFWANASPDEVRKLYQFEE